MNSEVTIPRATYTHIERVLNEIRVKLRREELETTVDEDVAMKFMGYDTKQSMINARNNGLVPADAYITLTNGKRRYFLNKLIKNK